MSHAARVGGLIVSICLLACASSSVRAASWNVDLLGKAGPGMLAGNENGTINGTPGSGGEVGAGITYDDVTNLLDIHVGWGSANGFTDLTGTTTGGHIHGPTAGAVPTSFTQNAGVMIPLDSLAGWNSSVSAGGFNGSVTLTETQEGYLFNGQLYMNAHTTTNSGGEIRGQLIVPEPASAALLAASTGLLLGRRRTRCRDRG